jgi:non-specific serine/threonine protein kinase
VLICGICIKKPIIKFVLLLEPKNISSFALTLLLKETQLLYSNRVWLDIDTITYLEKKASPEVLQSMGITVGNLDSTTKKILSLCEY